MRARESSSSITTKADGTLRFPLAWTDSPVVINKYNYACLTTDEVEVLRTLDEFKVMESYTIIILRKGMID